MSLPLIAPDAPLSTSLLAAVAIGVGFGIALEQAGLGSSRKLIGQFYGRDLTVLKVMFTALTVAMLGVFWLGRFGLLEVDALHVPETRLWPQLAGAALFGSGLLIAGLCPGTACVALASGRIDGAFVLLGLLGGMLATGLWLDRIEGFYLGTTAGRLTLPEWLGWSYGAVVGAVVLLALGAFVFAGWLERRAS